MHAELPSVCIARIYYLKKHPRPTKMPSKSSTSYTMPGWQSSLQGSGQSSLLRGELQGSSMVGLNVEDDAGLIPHISSVHSSLMPGHSFNSATQVVALCIVGFAGGAAFQVSLSETLYFKLAEDEVFGVEQENQFIYPGNKQRDNIVTFHNDLPADLHIHLFGRHHQAFHALGSVNEQFRQCTTVSVQADIGGMLEHLIGFLRHHFASRNTAPTNLTRLLDVTGRAISFPSYVTRHFFEIIII